MPTPSPRRVLSKVSSTLSLIAAHAPAAMILVAAARLPAQALPTFCQQLQALPFKIAYECYVNDNWEIFVMNPDGSGAVNLTHTPDLNEHYPQISPDGSKISFTLDEGEGREAVRSLCVMDIDGKNRKKLADHA